jgi:uncharacterized membrane protein
MGVMRAGIGGIMLITSLLLFFLVWPILVAIVIPIIGNAAASGTIAFATEILLIIQIIPLLTALVGIALLISEAAGIGGHY